MLKKTLAVTILMLTQYCIASDLPITVRHVGTTRGGELIVNDETIQVAFGQPFEFDLRLLKQRTLFRDGFATGYRTEADAVLRVDEHEFSFPGRSVDLEAFHWQPQSINFYGSASEDPDIYVSFNSGTSTSSFAAILAGVDRSSSGFVSITNREASEGNRIMNFAGDLQRVELIPEPNGFVLALPALLFSCVAMKRRHV